MRYIIPLLVLAACKPPEIPQPPTKFGATCTAFAPTMATRAQSCGLDHVTEDAVMAACCRDAGVCDLLTRPGPSTCLVELVSYPCAELERGNMPASCFALLRGGR